MTAATTVPELVAAAAAAADPASGVRLNFTPHAAGVHLVVGHWGGAPLLCGWVIGWTPGEPFPADTNWSMVIEMAPYSACRHPVRVVVW